MNNGKILVIEDDKSIRDVLEILLQSRGFQAELENSGERGLARARQSLFDLNLLDLTLPGMDGLEVCRTIHQIELNAQTPIVMLTARGEESDIVVGLEMGAVDYIVKPFNNQTLIARIRAQMRRTQELSEIPAKKDDSDIIQREGFIIHKTERWASCNGRNLELTFTEFELLLFLIQRPGRAWSRSEIAQSVRGDEYAAFDRAIDVQIANLRKKIGSESNRIETVRGIGYRWQRQEL